MEYFWLLCLHIQDLIKEEALDAKGRISIHKTAYSSIEHLDQFYQTAFMVLERKLRIIFKWYRAYKLKEIKFELVTEAGSRIWSSIIETGQVPSPLAIFKKKKSSTIVVPRTRFYF